MNVYTDIKIDGWERVVKCDNEALDMVAYIGVHNIQQGHALGGCRFWNYDCDENALSDVLRLSKAMTYKNCLAEVCHGGGKSVISATDGQVLTDDMLRSMGDFVNYVNKNQPLYEIAEDVGVACDKLEIIREVAAMAAPKIAGDPSPITAEGTFRGIVESWKYISGSSDFSGVHIAVQGVGAVGYELVSRLVDAGFSVTASDIKEENLHRVQKDFGIKIVKPEHIYFVPMDIFAPCALYGTVSPWTIEKMSATLIAGCANNQLSSLKVSDMLYEKGIFYAPDYVVNAGGVIQVIGIERSDSSENETYNEALVDQHLDIIPRNLLKIFNISNNMEKSTQRVADEMVKERLGLD